MKQDRLARVNRQLQAELAEMIPSLIRDPRVHEATLITVVEVRVTPDLGHARVFLSILGQEPRRGQALAAIAAAAGFLRSELGRRVRLRYIPALHFVLDTSLDSAAHIDQILRELATADTDDPEGPDDE